MIKKQLYDTFNEKLNTIVIERLFKLKLEQLLREMKIIIENDYIYSKINNSNIILKDNKYFCVKNDDIKYEIIIDDYLIKIRKKELFKNGKIYIIEGKYYTENNNLITEYNSIYKGFRNILEFNEIESIYYNEKIETQKRIFNEKLDIIGFCKQKKDKEWLPYSISNKNENEIKGNFLKTKKHLVPFQISKNNYKITKTKNNFWLRANEINICNSCRRPYHKKEYYISIEPINFYGIYGGENYNCLMSIDIDNIESYTIIDKNLYDMCLNETINDYVLADYLLYDAKSIKEQKKKSLTLY